MKPQRPPASFILTSMSASSFTCLILVISFISTVNCVISNVLALIEENSFEEISNAIRITEMSLKGSFNVSFVTISRDDSFDDSLNYACSNTSKHQAKILLSFLDSDLSYLADALSSSTQLPLLSIRLGSSNDTINAYDELNMVSKAAIFIFILDQCISDDEHLIENSPDLHLSPLTLVTL